MFDLIYVMEVMCTNRDPFYEQFLSSEFKFCEQLLDKFTWRSII